MKPRSVLTVVALTLLGAASASSFADEGKTYKLSLTERWKAGDTVSRTSKEVGGQHLTVKGPDGAVVQEKTDTRTTTSQLVVKTVEVDDKGQPTKSRLYFVNWNMEGGETKDDSLAGVQIEVTGQGKDRAWKVLTPGKTASDGAKAWLDQAYGPKPDTGEAMKAALAPKKEVAVGESWAPDLEELGKAFSEHMKVDTAKSSGKVTLTSVEGEMAHLAIELSLLTTSIISPAGELPWKEGGEMKLKMELVTPIDGTNLEGTYEAGMTLKGIAEVEGANVTLEITNEGQGASKRGGEIPALPAPEIK